MNVLNKLEKEKSIDELIEIQKIALARNSSLAFMCHDMCQILGYRNDEFDRVTHVFPEFGQFIFNGGSQLRPFNYNKGDAWGKQDMTNEDLIKFKIRKLKALKKSL